MAQALKASVDTQCGAAVHWSKHLHYTMGESQDKLHVQSFKSHEFHSLISLAHSIDNFLQVNPSKQLLMSMTKKTKKPLQKTKIHNGLARMCIKLEKGVAFLKHDINKLIHL